MKMKMIAWLGIGFVLGTAAFTVSNTVRAWSEKRELPLERYGLPKGYNRPANIKNWNEEVICILYPDGKLEKRASDDLIIRTLIDRLVEGQKQIEKMNRVLARANVMVMERQAEIQKENQGWFKRLIAKRKEKKEDKPSKRVR